MSEQENTEQNNFIHTTEVTIVNKKGLHARASAIFVKLANSFDANILVSKGKTEVLGSSIMGLLLLAAGIGEVVTLKANGPQAKEAIEGLRKLIENKFYEDN
jgi:phosphocarrier protein